MIEVRAIIFDYLGVLYMHGDYGWQQDARLLVYIQELRASYKIGLLSNFSVANMDKTFPPASREQFFDAVLTSEEAGIAKPYPEIYHLICRQLGVEPAQAVFVDDSGTNIKGAQAVGMRAILYRGFATFQQDLAEML